MALATTAIDVTTVATGILSGATTWAHNRNCSLQDPISLAVRNSGATIVRVGSSAVTSASGYPISTGGGVLTWDVKVPGEVIYAVTSASTSFVDVMADRQ